LLNPSGFEQAVAGFEQEVAGFEQGVAGFEHEECKGIECHADVDLCVHEDLS